MPINLPKKMALVLAMAAGLLACDGNNKTAQEHLESAREYYQQRQYPLATVELKNAIRKDSSLADAYFLQAKIFEQADDWKSMHTFLGATLQQQPEHIEANLEMASFYARASNNAAARKFFDLAVAAGASPFQLALTDAILYLNNHELTAAETSVAEALRLQPESEEAIVIETRIAIEQQRYAQALAILDRTLASRPDSEKLLLLRSRTYVLQGDYAHAAQQTLKLIELDPQNLEHYYLRAALLTRNGDADGAEKALRLAIQNNPEETAPKIALAGYINAKNEHQRAIDILNGYINGNNSSKNNEIKLILAGLYQSQQNYDTAKSLYGEISQSEDPSSVVAKNKLALIALKENRIDDAMKILDGILVEEFNNIEALTSRSLVFIAKDQPDKAITDLLNALREKPDSEINLLLIAQAYYQIGDIPQALKHLKQLNELNPVHAEGTTLFTQLLNERGQFNDSIAVLTQFAAQKPLPDLLHKRLLEAFLATRQWNQAKAHAKLIAEKSSQPQYSAYIDAYILQLQNQHENSIAAFTHLINRSAYVSLSLSGVVKSYQALGQRDQAIRYLKDFLQNNGEDLYAISLLATEYLGTDQTEAAKTLLTNTLQSFPEWSHGHFQLAVTHSQLGEWEQAIAAANQALGSGHFERSTTLLLMLASAHEQLGNDPQAIDFYRRALTLSPKLDSAANNLALLLSRDNATLQEALTIALRLGNSTNPSFLDTAGWIHYLNGNLQNAAALLEKAVFSAPKSAIIQWHLGTVLYDLKEFEKARKHLQLALATASDPQLREHAEILLQKIPVTEDSSIN